jgi:hypothetical protein
MPRQDVKFVLTFGYCESCRLLCYSRGDIQGTSQFENCTCMPQILSCAEKLYTPIIKLDPSERELVSEILHPPTSRTFDVSMVSAVRYAVSYTRQ